MKFRRIAWLLLPLIAGVALLWLWRTASSIPVGAEAKIQQGVDTESPALQSLTIRPLAGQDIDEVERRIVALGGTVVERVGVKDGVPRLRVFLAGSSIKELAGVAEVKWIERFVRPRLLGDIPSEVEPARVRLLNDVAVGESLMNVASVRALHNLTGAGEVVTTSDSGIDTGDLTTMHEDLRPNVIGFGLSESAWLSYYRTSILSYDASGHGTHTAGSIVGTGAKSNGQIKGVAYEAKLWAWFCGGKDGYVYTPDSYTDIFRPEALGTTNAYIHSASWGGNTNVYSSESQAIDKYCWEHPDFLPVFAAGNDGVIGSICEQGGAKNALCVGATESYRPSEGGYANNPDDLAYFSSRGPMPDGRIKPDICAPGTYIVSTRSSKSTGTGWGVYNDYYLYNSGTSMATPLIAGAATLVRQWLVRDCGYTNTPPSSALLKAILTGGATRLGTVPNSDFGWGRVNLAETLFPSNGLGVALQDHIPFAQDSIHSFVVTTTNAAPLDVQLCWIDYPAEPNKAALKSLVIDLDLVVSNETTGAVYTPNDHTNNLESVRIELAEPGYYTISVHGNDTAGYDSTQGGAAAVYVRGAFTSQAADTNEYVTVVVTAEGGGDQNCSPEVGTHTYLKGSTVTFTAGKYEDDGDGTDYRYSSVWDMDIERYPLIGTNVVTLTLECDTNVVWRWTEQPSQVALWLETYYDTHSVWLYPGSRYGKGWWVDYGEEVELTPADAPILNYYEGANAGLDVDINGAMYTSETDPWGYAVMRNFTTLKLTSFFVMEDSGYGHYQWDETRQYRMPNSLVLPMTAFTAVDFGYADKTDAYDDVGLLFWWWARNFWGLYENEVLTLEDTSAAGDPDGDGFTNLAEYTEPTDPMDGGSFPFRFTEFSPTGATFIGSVAGSLRVERTDRLGGVWSNVWENAEARESVTNHIDFMAGSGSSGFYRVIHREGAYETKGSHGTD